MRTVRSIRTMQTVAKKIAGRGKTIALVPTMGALHEGHLSLIRRAAKEADVVITTIFVNPAQFGPKEDLEKYPRDARADIEMISGALGTKARTGIVFLPRASDIYPEDFETWVTVEKLTKMLEGARRPTHFRGVTTVVTKLFNICRPDVALFGMKDYQQAVVLKRMTKDLGFPIKFIIAPTVREEDGLAMSSRNRYFDERQRWEAVCLFYALRSAKSMVKSGVVDTEKITAEMESVIHATCKKARVHYIAFTEFNTLKPVDKVTKDTVCSLSVRLHGVELIDNMKLG